MNPFLWFQAWVFESCTACGPEIAGLLAGFVVPIGTELHLTPAGEQYLTTLEQEG